MSTAIGAGLRAIAGLLLLSSSLAGATASALAAPTSAIVNDPGCSTASLPRMDDGSSDAVPLGFSMELFGDTLEAVYVNNNGNATFGGGYSGYSGTSLTASGYPMIAAAFYDVDTRGAGSQPVSYGQTVFEGRPAFCINWLDAGYFNSQVDRVNSFQLLLVSRADVADGAVDIVMNYGQIAYERPEGLTVGIADGSSNSFMPAGSNVPGALIDGNAETGLIHTSTDSAILGRHVYPVRSGIPAPLREAQTVALDAVDDREYAGQLVPIAATASSGLPVSLAASGACVPEGSGVRLTTDGTCSVTAFQEGSDFFLPAEPVHTWFEVIPAPVPAPDPSLPPAPTSPPVSQPVQASPVFVSPPVTEPDVEPEVSVTDEAVADPARPAASSPASSDSQSVPEETRFTPWNPLDHPEEVIALQVSGMAILGIMGAGGLAGSLRRTSGARSGNITDVWVRDYGFSWSGVAPGDASHSWRWPGTATLDRLSRNIPTALSRRFPLVAALVADGAYLRAFVGSAWYLLPVVGVVLGVLAATDSAGLPLPPAVLLTGAILAVSILDALSGVVAAAAFTAGVVIAGGFTAVPELPVDDGLRSLLGIASFWFAIPLVSAAMRPFRRPAARGIRYLWERSADVIVTTLVGAWLVNTAVSGMPGLAGVELSITDAVPALVLTAVVAVLVRAVIEEITSWLYPTRLKLVQYQDASGDLSVWHQWRAVVARAAVMAFIGVAFIGPCWQLWVGVGITMLPYVLTIYQDRFPNYPRLFRWLPEDPVDTVGLLVLGALAGALATAVFAEPESQMQNSFVLVAIPVAIHDLLGLVGRSGDAAKWSWRRQLWGAVAVGAGVTMVLNGLA